MESNYVSVDGELTDLYRPLTDILGLQYNETMTYEERVQKRYNYVKEQLEKDPNYEGWDWAEYQVYSNKQDAVSELLCSDKALVSTKGKIAKKKLTQKGLQFLLEHLQLDIYVLISSLLMVTINL